MAPKELSNYSNLEDLGWQKMNIILDKELPQKKRDQRGLIWWWGSGIAAAVLLALIFVLPKVNFDTAHSANNIIEENNAAEQFTPKKENMDGVNSISNSNSSASASADTNSDKRITASATAKDSYNQDFEDDQIASQGIIKSIETLLPASDNKQEKTIASLELDNKNKSISFPLENALMEDTERPHLIASELIESKSLGLLAFNSDQPKFIFHIPTQKNNTFQPGLVLLSNFSSQSSYGELGGGVNLDWNITDRWTLSSGLIYSRRSNLAGIGQDSALELADMNSSPISSGGGSSFNASADQSLSGNDIGLRQWSLPIRASYEFSPGWKMSLQSIISYLNINETAYSEALGRGVPTSIAISPIQNWNLHSGIGLGRAINPDLTLWLNYNWLLNNKNSVKTNFESSELHLAIQYNLN